MYPSRTDYVVFNNQIVLECDTSVTRRFVIPNQSIRFVIPKALMGLGLGLGTRFRITNLRENNM